MSLISNARIASILTAAIAAALSPAKMLIYAALLHPAEYGTLAVTILASAIVIYAASSGVLDGMLYSLSRRPDDSSTARSIKLNAFVFILFSGTIFGLAAALLVPVVSGNSLGTSATIVTWCFLTSGTLLAYCMMLLQTMQLATMYFVMLSAKNMLAIVVVFGVAHVDWSYERVLALDSIINFIVISIIIGKFGELAAGKISRDVLYSLIRAGWAFNAYAASKFASSNVDRIVVAPTIGAASYAAYGLYGQICLVPQVIANFVQVFFSPRLIEMATEQRGVKKVYLAMTTICLCSLLINAVAMSVVNIIAVELIPVYLPEYQKHISLLAPFSVAALFIAANQTEIFFRAVNAGRYLLITQLANGGALSLALLALSVRGSPQVSGYAWAYAFGCGALMLSSFLVATALYRKSR